VSEDLHGPKPHILIIEDNPADVRLVLLALREAGLDCELTVLEDGARAIAYVQERGQSGDRIPDLTILDLNIPKRDGLEILRAMRACPAFAAVPVVVLTSSSSPRERATFEALGVARHVTKSIELDAFMSIGHVVKEVLSTARRA
jgi:CheY-like chemotaxis protein